MAKKQKPLQIEQLPPGVLATDKQCAGVLAISRAHFWKAPVGTGLVPPVRLSPRTTRFRSDDVLALMKPVEC